MSARAKTNEDPGLASPAVLKSLVAVSVSLQEVTRTVAELRTRIESGADNQSIAIVTLSAALDASELIGRLVKLQITLASEQEE
jgi:hypothetical protein